MSDTALAWAPAIPFIGLLLTIALAPFVAPRLWHGFFPAAVAFWTLLYVLPATTIIGLEPTTRIVASIVLTQYVPFALLIGALFGVAGGLRITGTPRGTPAVNTALLALGTTLASLIGTVGAAMVMIRPIIRANRHRRRVTHIFVFFIILVANIGGALTPLGNPPIFVGYLAGVPFLWPLTHLWAPTLVVAGGMLAVFYALDTYVHSRRQDEPAMLPEIEKLGLEGTPNLVLLAATIGALMLRSFWHPPAALVLLGCRWDAASIATDALLIAIGALSMLLTPAALRRRNEFSWRPAVEVVIIFAGIFITMAPVMAIVERGMAGPAAPLFARLTVAGGFDNRLFYGATGLLSALLDNAPTYLVFFGLAGNDAARLIAASPLTLMAISAGAAFFGALTYVGNAPNLVIKALAESHGIAMPGFFAYAGWALLCAGPWLLLVAAFFF